MASGAPADGPELLRAAATSTARGAAVGAAVGVAFHAIGGGAVRALGSTRLSSAHVIGAALGAGSRLAVVFGLFTAVRCAAEDGAGLRPSLAAASGGAVAVAASTLADTRRRDFLASQLTAALAGRGRAGPAAVAAASAVSGAALFAALDGAMRMFGTRW